MKLVTSKKEGQQFAEYLHGQKSASSGKVFPPSSSPKHTHSSNFKIPDGTRETFNPGPGPNAPPKVYGGEPVVTVPHADLLKSMQSSHSSAYHKGAHQKQERKSNGF